MHPIAGQDLQIRANVEPFWYYSHVCAIVGVITRFACCCSVKILPFHRRGVVFSSPVTSCINRCSS
jgi:hypothetical protein